MKDKSDNMTSFTLIVRVFADKGQHLCPFYVSLSIPIKGAYYKTFHEINKRHIQDW